MSSLPNGFLTSDTRRGWVRTGAAVLVLAAALVLLVRPASVARAGQPPTPNLRERVAQLEAQVAALQAALDAVEETLAPFSTVADGAGGYDVYLTGANLHLENGLGSTRTKNGLGNLIVGYNELEGLTAADRAGSHNLVVGPGHGYVSYGGLIAGCWNYVSGPSTSISGGFWNTASGEWSSVSGGEHNTASGERSSVSGGQYNTASGEWSSVSGGKHNTASGERSSVSGGLWNTASGNWSSVSGGNYNAASGRCSSVTGGIENTASGECSTVSGGHENSAGGENSVVSGGYQRSAVNPHDWRAGGLWQNN
jgi:hypothetical protein